MSRPLAIGVSLLAIAVAVSACGSQSAGVVARVGATPITASALDNWISVMATGTVPQPGQPAYDPLERRALEFLIESHWLLAEAAERGLPPTREEVARRLKAKQHEMFPGGEAEFREYLTSTGQSTADANFRVEVEVAAENILHQLAGGEPAITRARVAGYYAANRQRFVVPERRTLELVEVTTEAAAQRARREIQAGRSVASLKPLHEELAPHELLQDAIGKRIEKAVFAARPNVLTGPLKLRERWSVYEVTRVRPALLKPLAQVRQEIREQLASQQRQQTVAAFVREWASRWAPRTDCAAGLVVQRCRQYRGPQTTAGEDPFSSVT
jgi:foldase protein PrsA